MLRFFIHNQIRSYFSAQITPLYKAVRFRTAVRAAFAALEQCTRGDTFVCTGCSSRQQSVRMRGRKCRAAVAPVTMAPGIATARVSEIYTPENLGRLPFTGTHYMQISR